LRVEKRLIIEMEEMEERKYRSGSAAWLQDCQVRGR